MYGNGIELGHLALFIHSNWWLIFAIFALVNLIKYLWVDNGKSGKEKLSRASALARAQLALKRKTEEIYDEDEIKGVIAFEEESVLLRDKALCPDARSVEQEMKSWSKHQDAMAKKRAKKEQEDRADKEFRPQFRQKRRNNRPQLHQKRRPDTPQRSEKTTEIWLPGGQIKRV